MAQAAPQQQQQQSNNNSSSMDDMMKMQVILCTLVSMRVHSIILFSPNLCVSTQMMANMQAQNNAMVASAVSGFVCAVACTYLFCASLVFDVIKVLFLNTISCAHRQREMALSSTTPTALLLVVVARVVKVVQVEPVERMVLLSFESMRQSRG